MKILIFILTFVFASFSAQADSPIDVYTDYLNILYANSGDIEVYIGDGSDESYYAQLSELLSGHSRYNNHLNAPTGSVVLLTNTSITCENGDTAAGSSFFPCTLVLTDGDYIKTENGYEGPETESALIINFVIRRSNATGALEIWENKAKVSIAG